MRTQHVAGYRNPSIPPPSRRRTADVNDNGDSVAGNQKSESFTNALTIRWPDDGQFCLGFLRRTFSCTPRKRVHISCGCDQPGRLKAQNFKGMISQEKTVLAQVAGEHSQNYILIHVAVHPEVVS